MLTTIPLLFIYLSVVYATAPIAQHQIFHAGPNSELVIKLRGYDADGDVLTATISPGDTNAGKLYQLSQVYSDYGYEPKTGDEMSSNSIVTGSNNRIVFAPTRDTPQPRNAPWRQFTYTVNDGSTTSNVGIVKIVGSDKVLIWFSEICTCEPTLAAGFPRIQVFVFLFFFIFLI